MDKEAQKIPPKDTTKRPKVEPQQRQQYPEDKWSLGQWAQYLQNVWNDPYYELGAKEFNYQKYAPWDMSRRYHRPSNRIKPKPSRSNWLSRISPKKVK